MIRGDQIAAEGLTDWRKLAQGLHARYRVVGFGEAARFVTAVGAGGDDLGHHPRVRIGEGVVDLARRITQIAAELGLTADPAGVSEVELGLDVTDSAKVAPVWAALLTGDPQSQGRGTPGDEIRDADVRIPNLWFGEVDPEGGGGQRFHLEVYVATEQVEGRVAAAVAAGGEVVDDSQAPGLTVIADPEGNRAVLCADMSAAPA